MTEYRDLGIALIARDRYTPAVTTLRAAVADAVAAGLRAGVYVADPGYPSGVREELVGVGEEFGAPVEVVDVGKFATTNHSWNQLLPGMTEQLVLALENDVVVNPGCLATLVAALDAGGDAAGAADIAVPVVYEADGQRPHFRPRLAAIRHLPGYGVQVALDRGRTDETAESPGARAIQIFERHCFLIRRPAALALGDWDELMFCRTDLDLSLLCEAAHLRVTFLPTASVRLADETLRPDDLAFFDYRWDEHRVGRSHRRLIDKWQLVGYKSTYNHVYDARRRLARAQ